ncbi:MAG: double-strand break repair protein AddB [Roseitalea sp.]|nr:double-strand break repair protein AddB [Roseitalea sp.]MBO6721882.1 double-strand break repair protein AddB [Roseitalea sp.]MBO6743053.1 double-strand break repair protein AddB [Roseitalea sp.]
MASPNRNPPAVTETRYVHPNVFTVAPGAPFLPAIADGLLDGRLIDGFAFDGDPMGLARAAIYVPTRRAARELRSVFMDALGQRSILLPRIRPLGEFDEDAAFFAASAGATLSIPPAIEPLERQLALGTLTARWTEAMTDDLHALYGIERVTTPVSTADAFWMAADLAGLIDQLQTEGIPFKAVEEAAGAEVSEWWNVTLAFLQIVKRAWPAHLAEANRLDPADHRNRMIRAEAARLAAAPPDGPVIVAGSTGTIPATAELIATVARLPKGAVVLPGYDTAMDGETRVLLETDDDATPVIGHPQFGMHTLVRAIGIAPDAVDHLGAAEDNAVAARSRWVAAALAPAERTADWAARRASFKDAAFSGTAILHAADERAEALAIACVLRETILDPQATAALVTPDRQLARRVATELARFAIEANDSGGTPFSLTPHGGLLALTLPLAAGEADPAALLALLKHPLARFGAHRSAHRAAVAHLEMLALRGGTGRIRLDTFATFAENALARWADDGRRKPGWFKTIDADAFDQACHLAGRIEAAFAPLCEVGDATRTVPLDEAVRATIWVLEAIARDGDGRFDALYAGESGVALEGLLRRLRDSATSIAFPPDQWPDMMRALTASMAIKPAGGGHPRISIWGTLEARLQTVDLMVLGGLNEGTWPAQTSNDAFLTRSMKTEIGLDPPERRIGLAAHDFQMAMGNRRVLLTRAMRAGGAPAVASRWLQRLETLAGADRTAAMHAAGEHYARLAEMVAAPIIADPVGRPAPQPPLAARPKALSVTEVETLRRDPYAVYARRVLELAPLDPLVRDPDFADRGSLIHKVMEEAARAPIDWPAEPALAMLERLARDVFDAEKLPPEIDAVWWARMHAALPRIVAWEAERQPLIAARHPEARAGPMPIGATGVTLRGYADRVDARRDGLADIIDFKTGAAPSAPQVQALLAPQLPLEAALLERGAFDGADQSAPGDLIYVRLGARGDLVARSVSGGKNDAAAMLAERAWEKLEGLCAHYNNPDSGYPSRLMPFREADFDGDYDHLARALEWADAVRRESDG